MTTTPKKEMHLVLEHILWSKNTLKTLRRLYWKPTIALLIGFVVSTVIYVNMEELYPTGLFLLLTLALSANWWYIALEEEVRLRSLVRVRRGIEGMELGDHKDRQLLIRDLKELLSTYYQQIHEVITDDPKKAMLQTQDFFNQDSKEVRSMLQEASPFANIAIGLSYMPHHRAVPQTDLDHFMRALIQRREHNVSMDFQFMEADQTNVHELRSKQRT